MICFKLMIIMYLYFFGLVAIGYLSKKIVEIMENIDKKKK